MQYAHLEINEDNTRAADASTRTESKCFHMCYRVHESQTSENVLSAFSPQVQGETP